MPKTFTLDLILKIDSFTEIPRQSAHKDLKKSEFIITITSSFF